MQAEIPRNTGILGVFSRFMMGLVQPMGKVHSIAKTILYIDLSNVLWIGNRR